MAKQLLDLLEIVVCHQQMNRQSHRQHRRIAMQQVLETELLGYCFRPLGALGTELLDSPTDSEAEALRRGLGAFLLEQATGGDASAVIASAVEVPASRDFQEHPLSRQRQ
jgi:hypothetical protein